MKKMVALLFFFILLSLGRQETFKFKNYFFEDEWSCARYSCVDNKDFCAKSKINGSEISVTLSPICKKGEYCDVGGDPNKVFYEGKEVRGKCKSNRPSTQKRYPGEHCTENSQCIYNNICDENTKRCTGKSVDTICSSNIECLSGLYCDQKRHRCTQQKDLYGDCSSSYECSNNLLCHNSHCSDVLYKLPVGTKVESVDEDIPNDYYCLYGMSISGVCVEFWYEDPELNLKEEKVECKRNDLCHYIYNPIKFGTFTLPCQCGYNRKGNGYCPFPHSVENEKWGKLMKIKRLKAINSCHSLNRFNCYETDEDLERVVRHAKDELVYGAQFYKSEICAKKVFDDTD